MSILRLITGTLTVIIGTSIAVGHTTACLRRRPTPIPRAVLFIPLISINGRTGLQTGLFLPLFRPAVGWWTRRRFGMRGHGLGKECLGPLQRYRPWRSTARIVSWLTPKSAARDRRLLVAARARIADSFSSVSLRERAR